MKQKLLSIIMLLSFAIGMNIKAQEKIYLVKGNTVVASFSKDEVEYMTFQLDETIDSGTFTISIDEVTPRSVLWTVTPANDQMYYYSGVYSQVRLDEFGSAEAMAERLYHDMSFLAAMVGVSPEVWMEEAVLYKGEAQIYYDQIGPGSDLVIAVFGCTPQGHATTETYTGMPFHTPEVEGTGMQVSFSADIEGTEVTLTAVPSIGDIPYYVVVAPSNEDVDLQDEVNTMIWRGGVIGKDLEQVLQEITWTGQHTETYSLAPLTQFTAYACSLNEEGVVNSAVSKYVFTTGEVQPSLNTFAIIVDEVGPAEVKLTVIPSNDDVYTCGIAKAAEVAGLPDNELAQWYLTNKAFAADYNTRSGEANLQWTDLDGDTEYVFFAFGIMHGVPTTEVAAVRFTTLPSSNPADFVATFSDFQMTGDTSASLKITVNQPDTYYGWGYVDANTTDDDVALIFYQQWERAHNVLDMPWADRYGIVGSQTVTLSGMEVGKTYKVVAVVVNEADGSLAAPICWSAPFTTAGME